MPLSSVQYLVTFISAIDIQPDLSITEGCYSMKKKQVLRVFVLMVVGGFLIEVLSPELQSIGLSARQVHIIGAGITTGGLLFLALNWSKSK